MSKEYDNEIHVLSPEEKIELKEPECLVDAIENGLITAQFFYFGMHATVSTVKEHMDEFVKKWESRQ